MVECAEAQHGQESPGGQLYNVAALRALRALRSVSLKLKLYRHAVISTLTHAHEAWKLTPGVMKRLNGWNSRCVSVITGRGIAKEAGCRQTFDLVSYLRVSRLRWLGHVLRMDPVRYVKQAAVALFDRSPESLRLSGSLLMDAPECSSFSELVALAGAHRDHAEWDQLVRALRKRITRAR